MEKKMKSAVLTNGSGPGSSIALSPTSIRVRDAIIEKFIDKSLDELNSFLASALDTEKDEAKLRDEVCIRVKNETNVAFGRHITFKDKIISEITRKSIDQLKANFRDEMEKSDWLLIVDHMKKLNIGKN